MSVLFSKQTSYLSSNLSSFESVLLICCLTQRMKAVVKEKGKNCFAQTLHYNCKPKAQAGSPPFPLLPLSLLPSPRSGTEVQVIPQAVGSQKKKKMVSMRIFNDANEAEHG